MYGNQKIKYIDKENDLVRQQYKRFKKKKPPPDYSDVIDVSTKETTKLHSDRVKKTENISCCGFENIVGLKCSLLWDIYDVKECPGLYLISNPFTESGLQYWTYQSLTRFTESPYPSNIDIHVERSEDKSIWESTKMEKEQSVKDTETSVGRLRWTHLGYHFDYNTVDYKREQYYGFPSDLEALMKCITSCLGFSSYNPETAIVNFYPVGSSMGGHTDHYEEELDQPLISISLGQPAIFLIGSDSRTTKPEAMWLRNGDVVVMSGKSRLAYHAVPAILNLDKRDLFPQVPINCYGYNDKRTQCCNNKEQLQEYENAEKCFSENYKILEKVKQDKNECNLISNYMSDTRININVRQVHKHCRE